MANEERSESLLSWRPSEPSQASPTMACRLAMTSLLGLEAGAENRDRTDDLILTMDVLYQLSYLGEREGK
ncbi:MAG: hypothetical protein RLZZ283_354 [Candidatus Parcubacteria bacterium]